MVASYSFGTRHNPVRSLVCTDTPEFFTQRRSLGMNPLEMNPLEMGLMLR